MSIKLVELTDPLSIDNTRVKNSSIWASHLSVDEYVLRDRILANSPMSKGMKVYQLEENGKRVCSLEIIIRDGLRYEKNSEDKVSKKIVKMGCIGGVFTDFEYRGKGYAKIMIDELNKISDDLDLDFVILYSEVGNYYSRCGYESKPVPLYVRDLEISDDKVDESCEFKDGMIWNGYTVDLVDYHGFDELMNEYNKDDDKRITELVSNDGNDRVTFTPTGDVLNWFHLRVKYFSHNLNEDPNKMEVNDENHELLVSNFKDLEPKKFGIKISKNGVMDGYIVWTFDFDVGQTEQRKEVKLTCNILHIYSRNGFKKQLIDWTRQYMKLMPWKVGKVKVWSSDISNEEFGGKEVENSSLSAIRFRDEPAIWENNNKLPWF